MFLSRFPQWFFLDKSSFLEINRFNETPIANKHTTSLANRQAGLGSIADSFAASSRPGRCGFENLSTNALGLKGPVILSADVNT